MNWTTILADEARRNPVIRSDELARGRRISDAAVRNALRRHERQGLVERISKRIYVNHLNQQFSPRDLVNILRPRSYISLESVMAEHGITTQSPFLLTCVTPGYPQSFPAKSGGIVYRKISPELYWGYKQKATRYNHYLIAEPEKALLDWIYLTRQEGLPVDFDELQLQFIDAAKLRKYAERFPRTVGTAVKELLLEKAFPVEEADRRPAERAGI
jgi:predicted transcriptional regulator of viral defense system